MEIESINTTQIITVGIFLLGLVALQIFVLKNKNRLSNSWRSSKRIQLIEEKSLSSTEKLRIISVDASQFLVISNKGKKSSLIPLGQIQKRSSSEFDARPSKIGAHNRSLSLKQNANSAIPSKTKGLAGEHNKGHQLSKAIQAARVMNPAVSYKE